ncbi:WD repeat, SAM and U-box domain-containing protein 1 isoform X2 [Narcine bancroftii]|uniref:WD repeat, SAM and U-box domain-containing protein 1 isoform X2 n=1 Tax=Narcine bancroftii TaxID=1343680 RepID=UPI0038317CE0
MVTLVQTITDHIDDVNCCAFSSTYLASCSLDKTIRLYLLKDFSELPFSPLKGHSYGVHSCCFSSCGKFLASSSTDGTTMLWNPQTGEKLAVLRQPSESPVRVCRFSPDTEYLVSGAADGTVALWDVRWKKLRRTSSVKDGSVIACDFSPGGGTDDYRFQSFLMASCGQDNKIIFWNLSCSGYDLRMKYSLNHHTAPVLSCCFSSDGHILVSGSVDKSIIIWDSINGIPFHILTQHKRYVTACAFAPDLPLIATGSMDKTVNVWRVESKNSANDYSSKKLRHSVQHWSEEEVCSWLSAEELQELVVVFKSNNIDGQELLNLTEKNLVSDLKIESLGLRNKAMWKIEELKSNTESTCVGVPDEFLCPITREIMTDPVIASDGYSYEREAIENWINTKKRTSPMTNMPLETTLITRNRTLKMAIDRWIDSPQVLQMTKHHH